MRQFNSLFALDRLSVLQRVAGGMGIILLLLAGLSVNSWRTITEVYNKADYVDSSVTEAAAVTEFAAQVSETRTRVTQYALSENDNDLLIAQRSLNGLEDEITAVTKAYAWAGGNDDAIVGNLRTLADRYRKSVAATIGAVNARRADGTKLLQSATELSTTVAAIVEALSHDTNAISARAFPNSAGCVCPKSPACAALAGLRIERDRWFHANKTLSAYAEEARRHQRIVA